MHLEHAKLFGQILITTTHARIQSPSSDTKQSMSNPTPVQQDDTCSSDSAHHNPLLCLLFHCSRLSQRLLWKTALAVATASPHSQRSAAYDCVASCNRFAARHRDVSRFASAPPALGTATATAGYTARKAKAPFFGCKSHHLNNDLSAFTLQRNSSQCLGFDSWKAED